MKLSYFLTGILVIVYEAIVMIVYVTNDNYRAVLILLSVVVLAYAAMCFFYSFRKEKVNFLSDISRNLLWFTAIVMIVLTLVFLSVFNTAQEASKTELFVTFIGMKISFWGSLISIFLMIASLFVKKVK